MNNGTISERAANAMAALTEGAMYTDEERIKYAQIIYDFNKVYYELNRQTWCATSWKGIPVLKAPTDLWIYQEIIARLKPDLIIETGTMRGGSAVFLDDMLGLINPKGKVISIDTQPEKIFKEAYDSHVKFITGSSVDPAIVSEVKACIMSWGCKKVMAILDSDHSKEHVMKELGIYGKLVTKDSALIVEDTSNSEARNAVEEWLPEHPEFTTDIGCEKFMLTFNRGGYLEKVVD
jgi:cephalosporin hydroxylase